jgi:hypothetical protein
VLEAVFVLLEPSSPSRRILIGSHSLPPLWFAVSVLQLHRRIRHLEHDLRDITARCCAERERRMSLELVIGGKIFILI